MPDNGAVMPRRSLFPAELYPVMVLRDYESERMAEFTDAEIAEIKRVEAGWIHWQKKIAVRFGLREDAAGDWEQSE